MCDSKTLSTSSLLDSTLNQSEIIHISSDSDGEGGKQIELMRGGTEALRKQSHCSPVLPQRW